MVNLIDRNVKWKQVIITILFRVRSRTGQSKACEVILVQIITTYMELGLRVHWRRLVVLSCIDQFLHAWDLSKGIH